MEMSCEWPTWKFGVLFLPQLLIDVDDSLSRVELFPDLVSTFQASSRRNKNKSTVMYRDSLSPPKGTLKL